MRATDTDRPTEWPSIEDLRLACDERIKAKGFPNRAAAFRKVNLAHPSFERVLRDGLSPDARPSLTRKLRKLGILNVVPRQ